MSSEEGHLLVGAGVNQGVFMAKRAFELDMGSRVGF